MSCFLGIDSGTSGIKAIVLSETGQILGEGYTECDLITPKPGWVEQEPDKWWEACCSAVKLAVANSGRGVDVVGVGLSGQMQGATVVDKEMRPVGACLIWLDQRSAAEAEELNTRMDVKEMLGITATYCLPSYWASKLLWLQRNRPEDYERIYKVMFTKDFLRYKMTGEIATEASDASLSFLLDMNTRQWSDRMLEVTGISRDILPERVYESPDVAGYLRADIAAEWGVKAGIPVAAGGGDQPAGGVGNGIIETGVISSVIGTSGVVFGCCDVPFVDEQRRAMYSLCHSVPGKYSFLGCTLGAGGSFKWLRDTVFEDRKAALAQRGEDVYDHMASLAAKAPVGSEGLCFLPYLNGESTPHVDPDARGVFFGLSYRHGIGSVCRSVMEGVTFSLRDTIEIMREFGLTINEVRAMGGGAKSPLWRQIQADIYNAEVVTMNMEEGPAAGGAIMGAVAAKHFASVEEGCKAILKKKSITEPIPENVEMYNEYYATYRALYPALKKCYATQAKIVEKHMEAYGND